MATMSTAGEKGGYRTLTVGDVPAQFGSRGPGESLALCFAWAVLSPQFLGVSLPALASTSTGATLDIAAWTTSFCRAPGSIINGTVKVRTNKD